MFAGFFVPLLRRNVNLLGLELLLIRRHLGWVGEVQLLLLHLLLLMMLCQLGGLLLLCLKLGGLLLPCLTLGGLLLLCLKLGSLLLLCLKLGGLLLSGRSLAI